MATSETVPQRYGWAGRERNAASGTAFFRYRIFAPIAGRFLTQDPLGQWGSPDGNLYIYELNCPASWVDYFGLAAWKVTEGAKYDMETIRKMKECIVKVIREMMEKGEKSDCADVAIAALIRCAEKNGLPLRFKYYYKEKGKKGEWRYFDSQSDKYKSREEFETEMRAQLGAINVLDNTKSTKMENVEPGDMFVYDLRSHGNPNYTGHTMPILGVTQPQGEGEGKTEWQYKVAEGHTSQQRGEGTEIRESTYTETEIKGKWEGPYQGGGREWNWQDIGGR